MGHQKGAMHPPHSLTRHQAGHLAGCGGVVAIAVNAAINMDDNLIVSQVLRGQIHGLHKALNIDIVPQNICCSSYKMRWSRSTLP